MKREAIIHHAGCTAVLVAIVLVIVAACFGAWMPIFIPAQPVQRS